MNIELTQRQWALYNYLKDKGDEWTYQATAAAEIKEYEYDGNEDFSLFHDCNTRHQMTADIRAINDSNVIQKIIISSGRGIKLANEEEFDLYIRKEIMAAVRRLERAKRKAEKGNRDGQMKITFGEYERDTVKAFIDSDKATGERLRLARLKSGLQAVEVVRRSNVKGFDSSMLSRIEHGLCLPNKTTLSELSKIYGVSTEYILTGEYE